MKRLVLILSVAVLATWGLYLMVPVPTMERALEENASRGGLSVEVVGAEKTLVPGLRAEGLDVKLYGQRLFTVEDVKASISPTSLLGLRAEASFEGRLAGGTVTGKAGTGKGGRSTSLSIRGAQIEKLGIYEQTGYSAEGMLDADVSVDENGAAVKLIFSDLSLSPVRFYGTSIPIDRFEKGTATVRIKGLRSASLEQASFEGPGIFASATGRADRDSVRASVEFMPEDEGTLEPSLRKRIEKFRISPGHYKASIEARTSAVIANAQP